MREFLVVIRSLVCSDCGVDIWSRDEHVDCSLTSDLICLYIYCIYIYIYMFYPHAFQVDDYAFS